MNKQLKYRVLVYENKAGGKIYYSQYLVFSIFGLFNYWKTFYYSSTFQFLIDKKQSYSTYCDAANAIKYHKMFGNDKDTKYVHNMSDI